MTSKPIERRLIPRIDIDSNINYRLPGDDNVYQAELRDLSSGGAGIWIQQELPLGSQLYCYAEPDESDEAPIEFIATLVRTFTQQKESMYGYGCMIQYIKT